MLAQFKRFRSDRLRPAVGKIAYFFVTEGKLLPIDPLHLFSERDPIGRQPFQCALYGPVLCLRRAIFGVGCSPYKANAEGHGMFAWLMEAPNQAVAAALVSWS